MSAPGPKAVKGPRSAARLAFFSNSDAVRSLWALHQEAKTWTEARRRHLGVANQGVYLLVAALWETYCEDLLFESLDHLVDGATCPDSLPSRLRRRIAAELREDQHELAAWRLAGEGWRDEARARAERLRHDLAFHSPKAAALDALFDKHLGMPSVSAAWVDHRGEPARQRLDEHLVCRGALAHRAAGTAITKAEVSDFYELASALTVAMDTAVGEHLANHVGSNPYAERAAAEVVAQRAYASVESASDPVEGRE